MSNGRQIITSAKLGLMEKNYKRGVILVFNTFIGYLAHDEHVNIDH